MFQQITGFLVCRLKSINIDVEILKYLFKYFWGFFIYIYFSCVRLEKKLICFKIQWWSVLHLTVYYSIKIVIALVSSELVENLKKHCERAGWHGWGCWDPHISPTESKVASGVQRATTPKPCSSKRIVHTVFYSGAKSHNNTAFTVLMRHVSSHYLVTVLLRTLTQQRCLPAFVLLSLCLHPKASWQSQDPSHGCPDHSLSTVSQRCPKLWLRKESKIRSILFAFTRTFFCSFSLIDSNTQRLPSKVEDGPVPSLTAIKKLL